VESLALSLVEKINHKLLAVGPFQIKPFYDGGSELRITHDLAVVGAATIHLAWNIKEENVHLLFSVFPVDKKEFPKGLKLEVVNDDGKGSLPAGEDTKE